MEWVNDTRLLMQQKMQIRPVSIVNRELDMTTSDEELVARLSVRHSVSQDAVRIILQALRAGGGTMAQFSHPDFGGMSQWSPGMTMTGEMFNNELKAKLDRICTALAAYLAKSPQPREIVARRITRSVIN